MLVVCSSDSPVPTDIHTFSLKPPTYKNVPNLPSNWTLGGREGENKWVGEGGVAGLYFSSGVSQDTVFFGSAHKRVPVFSVTGHPLKLNQTQTRTQICLNILNNLKLAAASLQTAVFSPGADLWPLSSIHSQWWMMYSDPVGNKRAVLHCTSKSLLTSGFICGVIKTLKRDQ